MMLPEHDGFCLGLAEVPRLIASLQDLQRRDHQIEALGIVRAEGKEKAAFVSTGGRAHIENAI